MQQCKTAFECKEPFYCLKSAGTATFTCQRMPCGASLPCRVGQNCGENGFCQALPCLFDSVCPGSTVCRPNKRCGLKSSLGETCSRDNECFSSRCIKKICQSRLLVEQPITRNRAADIAIFTLLFLSLVLLLFACIICLTRRRVTHRRPQAIYELDPRDDLKTLESQNDVENEQLSQNPTLATPDFQEQPNKTTQTAEPLKSPHPSPLKNANLPNQSIEPIRTPLPPRSTTLKL